MTAIEAVPSRVVEAMLVRSRDPDLTSDGEDIGAAPEIGRSLLGARPILVEEQPGRGDLLKVPDQHVQDRALPGWIRDDDIGAAVAAERQSILTSRDIVLVGAP